MCFKGLPVEISINNVFLLRIIFILANNAEFKPDEMPHYGIFHLDLHCLPKYLIAGNHKWK